jgi:hypothetical protein
MKYLGNGGQFWARNFSKRVEEQPIYAKSDEVQNDLMLWKIVISEAHGRSGIREH